MKDSANLAGKVGVVVIGIIGAAFVLNHFVRVSGSGRSHGIVENWLWGRSTFSALQHWYRPPNVNRWKDSAELSGEVARLLMHHRRALIVDPGLESERLRAAKMAREAARLAGEIPRRALAASNPDLPRAYSHLFIPAMELLAMGLLEKDEHKMAAGAEGYNSFLRWIQAQERGSLKPLK